VLYGQISSVSPSCLGWQKDEGVTVLLHHIPLSYRVLNTADSPVAFVFAI
jgi:hypothetical protein